MKTVILHSYNDFNPRRYGTPWVCQITLQGQFDFDHRIGDYTGDGRKGEAGDLVVFEPVKSQVYAYGQKDYRGKNTERNFVMWDGEKFIPCNKLGKPKDKE